MPRKVEYIGKDGSMLFSQEFSQVVVNPEMEESLFVFESPADAQVVDMTDGVINMFNAMKKSGGAKPGMLPPSAAPEGAPLIAPPGENAPAVETAPQP